MRSSTPKPLQKVFFFFFQHERGEEKNCFLNPIIEQVVVIRRSYKSRKKNLLSFSLFSGVFNNLDAPHCWGEIRKCQLMLRFLMIETHGTMFGQSLFASKLFFFFFTLLVSAKDEYEQYFLLDKKNVECTEKISSVFMLVVLIDEENLLDRIWTLLQSFYRRTCIFIVVRTSSGRDSLYVCFFSRYHRNTHQDDLLGNKMIATVLSSCRIC